MSATWNGSSQVMVYVTTMLTHFVDARRVCMFRRHVVVRSSVRAVTWCWLRKLTSVLSCLSRLCTFGIESATTNCIMRVELPRVEGITRWTLQIRGLMDAVNRDTDGLAVRKRDVTTDISDIIRSIECGIGRRTEQHRATSSFSCHT